MSNKLIRGELRKPGTWGAQLEPGEGLTPLSVVVAAALATVLFACGQVSDFTESALADRDALIARSRWEAARQQQEGRQAEAHAEVDAEVDAA